MPFYWMFSVFLLVYVFIMLIIMYNYSDIENIKFVNEDFNSELKISNFMW